MASPTQEELEQQREEVAQLRREVEEAAAERADLIAERTRETEAELLAREKGRLQAQLNRTQTRDERKVRISGPAQAVVQTEPDNKE